MFFALTMRQVLFAVGVASALVAAPAAQGTTGVAGINDYTLNGMTPGSSSCTLLSPFPSGPTMFRVNTAPGAPVVFGFNLNCPCKPCFFPWVPATCPLPALGCAAATNQAFELDANFASCVFLTVGTVANATGNATFTIVVPPLIRFSTQCALLHPCTTTLVFTQAYNVSTV